MREELTLEASVGAGDSTILPRACNEGILMLTIKNILLIFISSLIFVVLIPACSDYNSSLSESNDAGSVSFHVEWKGAPTYPERDNGYLRALDCQASNIETVIFDIRDENDISLAGDTWNCIAGNGIVNGVPAGTDRKLVVEGKDSQGRVLYRGIEEGIVVTAGAHSDVGEIVCEPMIVIGGAYLQYRTYEDYTSLYKGWLDFTWDQNPVAEDDIGQITLKNPAGYMVDLNVPTFWSISYIKGEWIQSTSQVSYSDPIVDTGFSIWFPEITNLNEGIYTYEVATSQAGQLNVDVYFPGEVTLPTVTADSMNYEWLDDGSLYLSWDVPVGDFDLLRIVLCDQDWQDFLYVTLPTDRNDLTLPTAQVETITNTFKPFGAYLVVQTRSYTETDDGNNYARGISSPVYFPWWPGYINGFGMTFHLIPAGSFTMGSPDGVSEYPIGSGDVPFAELGREADETPHQVTLTKPFYMQTTETTQAQWESVMGSNPSNFKSCGSNCPVENVSWEDIQTFLTTLNGMGEGSYRLPTEAEWEYASRAGSTTALTNGNVTVTDCSYDENLNALGWYCYNANSTTHPGAQKVTNAWGLYDMQGNVYEWCQDWYGGYTSTSVTDPIGVTDGSERVIRGGSWHINAKYSRSAVRFSLLPGDKGYGIGFRLVFEP